MNINSYIVKFGKNNFETMPFNDVDALIFAEFSYINLELLFKENSNTLCLKDIIVDELIDEVFVGSVDAKYNKKMLSLMIKSDRYKDLVISDIRKAFDKENANQFYALTITFPNKDLFISYRGTDTSLIGWKEDFSMIYEDVLLSQTQSLEYALDILNKYPNVKFYMGGHSKGGNASFYVVLNLEKCYTDRLIKSFSFDGPGFRNGFKHLIAYEEVKDKLIKYITHRDSIGSMFEDIDKKYIVYSNGFLLGGHDPFYWQVNKDGNFRYARQIAKRAERSNERFKAWLSTLSMKDRKFMVEAVFIVFHTSETVYDALHNFFASIRKANKSLSMYSENDRKKLKEIFTRLFRFLISIDVVRTLKKEHQKKLRNKKIEQSDIIDEEKK